MSYKTKNFEHLYGTPGFSRELLENHFTLYSGYVKKTNDLIEQIEKYRQEGHENFPESMELKRRFGWEFNGMRLHEYYFDNITKEAGDGAVAISGGLKGKISANFGSFESWEKDFKTTGAIRGIGWVTLVYDPPGDRLFNLWINEHDLGHCAGLTLLLVMDVFEHAYIQDYGLKREDYMNVFFKAVHWPEVSRRFQDI